ncbi:Putative glycosyl transferase CAP10 domain-containing protein [Septoria linicola]|uniref:Glycosyl transferase CAP10 domain-containing protein n=1 Tax=Septoria linicola TaxID=215465 RepID=A0A9Q9ACU8_9PEZI|nr:Putative glycosyl transferase CAP10 domain-containing protein [Septoria linicola]
MPSLAWLLTALLVSSILASISTSTKHSLLTSGAAWLAVWGYTLARIGARSQLGGEASQRYAWTAGILLALGHICERAVDGNEIWWAKALLPLILYSLLQGGILDDTSIPTRPLASPIKDGLDRSPSNSRITLVFLTLAGLVAISAHAGSITNIALGLSYAVAEVLAIIQTERAYTAQFNNNGGSVIYCINGLSTQATHISASLEERQLSIIHDVSFAGAIAIGSAGIGLEGLSFGGLQYYGLIGQMLGDKWESGQGILSFFYAVSTVLVQVVAFATLVIMICRQGALLTSFTPLAAAVSSQLLLGFSLSRLWFAALCAILGLSFLDEQNAFPIGSRMRTRYGRLLSFTALASFVCLAIYYFQQPLRAASHHHNPTPGSTALPVEPLNVAPPLEPLKPLEYAEPRTHPVKHLIDNAQASWNAKLQGQSQNLAQAVTEYRRRYGLSPPPHFDKWYEFAKRKGVVLIDDYDTIYHSLLPFWGLSPATIRARARESLGFIDNNLMGMLIRDGKVSHVEGGQDWLQQAAVGMMQQFIEYLPDMDLAFNVHDEPRVVVPHDELSRLIQIALEKTLRAAGAQQAPKDTFSPRPKDLRTGKRIEEVKVTRFNVFAHQPTWIPSRLSCSPDSPARGLEEALLTDNMTAYALSELGFSHGFFDRPNAFNVVHDLFPIFSQSKMSSFQDITYPSPWYWFGKVSYNENRDMDWAQKENRLWWRGSTTGGFSRAGGWRRQHRQKLVAKVNSLESAKILSSSNAGATDDNPGARKWLVKKVARPDFKSIMDVRFSHVGQCDPGDCDAQREYFDIAEPADQQDAWSYKYLLDMDGNAFSGRFYAFLMSHSLTFKMAVFREWHEEWIRPWVHYIPLSLKGEEVLEAVRYFDAEEEGRELATVVAEDGRSWAQKALRNEDFEVWLFRLLLEYGRVVDDNREGIGYSGG